VHVAELWRFPVKSFRGERLEEAEVREDGIPGDRAFFVRGGDGRKISARTKPKLLGLAAETGPNGDPLVDGRAWDDPATAAAVREAAGDGATLVRAESGHLHDDTPLLVATDGGIAAFGRDGRRLRPNIVIGGVEGLAEREWPGRSLRLGEIEVAVPRLRNRCAITTVDPDTLEIDPDVLRDINTRFGGLVALDGVVTRPGRIALGDPVELI
jgi:MOSC domain-containing protein